MIRLHHFGAEGSEFYLNPDLIVTIDARPDTIIHLINGHELYVAEAPDQVATAVLRYRIDVLRGAQPLTSMSGGVQADA
jgi:flagellar protein FlbD